MSGHSKWSKIKRAKGVKDSKRGALFTKLGRAITLAASEGGGDVDMNFSLRLAVEKAKIANMPSENIKRAIKKGTGELKGEQIKRISYEAYGPASSALIIDCATDNTNRTLSGIKSLVDESGGKMANAGSVSWKFSEKGLIVIRPRKLKKSVKYGAGDTYEDVDIEESMMELMEVSGVEDIVETKEIEDDQTIIIFEIITSREDLFKVDQKAREKGFQILSSELVKIGSTPIQLTEEEKEKVEKIVKKIEDHSDVESVWVDADLD